MLQSDSVCLALQMVEELMSIADGQIILQRTQEGNVILDFANSLSRMGLRAYAPSMQTLCPPIRLRLAQVTGDSCRWLAVEGVCAQAAVCMQAADEGKFGVGQDIRLAKGFTGRLQAVLQQQPGHPVPLCDQVCASTICTC